MARGYFILFFTVLCSFWLFESLLVDCTVLGIKSLNLTRDYLGFFSSRFICRLSNQDLLKLFSVFHPSVQNVHTLSRILDIST